MTSVNATCDKIKKAMNGIYKVDYVYNILAKPTNNFIPNISSSINIDLFDDINEPIFIITEICDIAKYIGIPKPPDIDLLTHFIYIYINFSTDRSSEVVCLCNELGLIQDNYSITPGGIVICGNKKYPVNAPINEVRFNTTNTKSYVGMYSVERNIRVEYSIDSHKINALLQYIIINSNLDRTTKLRYHLHWWWLCKLRPILSNNYKKSDFMKVASTKITIPGPGITIENNNIYKYLHSNEGPYSASIYVIIRTIDGKSYGSPYEIDPICI